MRPQENQMVRLAKAEMLVTLELCYDPFSLQRDTKGIHTSRLLYFHVFICSKASSNCPSHMRKSNRLTKNKKGWSYLTKVIKFLSFSSLVKTIFPQRCSGGM